MIDEQGRAWNLAKYIYRHFPDLSPEETEAVRHLPPKLATELVTKLFSLFPTPDLDGDQVRWAAGESLTQIVHSFHHRFKPDIPGLFESYLALYDRALAEKIEWLSLDPTRTALPSWAQCLMTCWQLAWTVSRASLKRVRAALEPQVSSRREKRRRAAVQLIAEAEYWAQVPEPPRFGGVPRLPDYVLELGAVGVAPRLPADVPVPRPEDKAATPEPTFRYPRAAFHRVSATFDEEIPPTSPLEQPPESDRLQFRFGFRTDRDGIPTRGEPAVLRPPRELPLPLDLEVDVWSEDLLFDTTSNKLTVPKDGASEDAAFPFRLKPRTEDRSRVALFVFLRRDNRLIGAFRVEASLAAPGVRAASQSLEYVFLDPAWFRLESRELTGPALSVYVRRENDRVAVFAFLRGRPAWGRVGTRAAEFQQFTQKTYRELASLAGRAARGERLPFARDADQLAHLGFQFFSDLFYDSPNHQPQLSDLATAIKDLPVGAEVVIAQEAASEVFLIPWGLLYHGKLPGAYTKGQEADGFWGHRFRLTVRPSSIREVPAHASVRPPRFGLIYKPPRFGLVYENHAEADVVRTFLNQAAVQGKLALYDLHFVDDSLPELASKAFDLLHFFCHGYTELADEALSHALREISAELTMPPVQHSLGSYLQSQSGTARMARLQETLQEGLASAPLVLLSMCHSAQVSASGRSFVTFFLRKGARAVIGTEGPIPFSLARRMDKVILQRLIEGLSLRDAVYEARRVQTKSNALALIYTTYGDDQATLVPLAVRRGDDRR